MDTAFDLAEYKQSMPRVDNGPAWDETDLIRIEGMQQRVYDLLQSASAQRLYIPFKLGGGKIAPYI